MSYLAPTRSSIAIRIFRAIPRISGILGAVLLGLNFATVSTLNAQGVIRDTEVENALRVYMHPLLQAAGIPDERLEFILISDDSINAAVLPGGRIIVHTGLLTKSESPLAVTGVFAHELGHYLNNDLVRLKGNRDKTFANNLLGLALGVGVSLAAQDGKGLIAGGFLGNQLSTRSQLSYSRSMEVGADRRAVDLMQRADLSLAGLVQLTEQMILESPDPNFAQAKYLSTHPLSQDRLAFYQRHFSQNGDPPLSEGWQELHERVRAKLLGFSMPPNEVRLRYPRDRNDVPAKMAQAIAAMRLAEYPVAVGIMDTLNQQYPEDGFLWDLAGDILKMAGDREGAISRYTQAIDLLPWASLIRYQRAALLLVQNTPKATQQAQSDLRRALRYEPEIPLYWYDLAETYRRQDAEDEAQMAFAEGALVSGNIAKAQGYARRVQQLSAKDSALWLRADDILQQKR